MVAYHFEPLCIWRYPFTECTLLDISPASEAFPSCISPDGLTIYGTAKLGGVWKACQWDTTTLTMTVLDDSAAPANNIRVVATSDDGSVIYGIEFGGLPYYNPAFGIMVRWVSGVPTLVPSPTDDAITFDWDSGNQPDANICSADGSVMIAMIGTGEFGGAYKWVNNVPSLLLGGAANINWNFAKSVTPDGSAIFGVCSNVNSCWIGTGRQTLASSPLDDPMWGGMNGDASVLWSVDHYWTNPTVNGGVRHTLDKIPSWDGTWSRSYIGWVSCGPGSTVAVGACPFGTPNDANRWGQQACRWDGTAITALGYIDDGVVHDQWSQAMGCNHDGSIVCGYSGLNASIPLWWDSSNTMHHLLTLADGWPYPGWKGEALGISRDGSVIYGRTSIVPPLKLRLVALEPVALPNNDYNFYADAELQVEGSIDQFSLSVWVCQAIRIELNYPPTIFEISRSVIAITMRDADNNVTFGGNWTIAHPVDEYQVLFSVDISARKYTLYVNDVAPTGTPSWGMNG